jgi:hypothetical protein
MLTTGYDAWECGSAGFWPTFRRLSELRAGRPRSQGGTMADQFSGWHTRGYLPHYDVREKVQAITYRLSDALPRDVCAQLDEQALGDAERRERLEEGLDAGYGSPILAAHGNAEIVADAWKHFDGERYRLHVWCVMPNHVHVLIAPVGGHRLPEIVQSQKSYTAKIILGRCPGTAGLRPRNRERCGRDARGPRVDQEAVSVVVSRLL